MARPKQIETIGLAASALMVIDIMERISSLGKKLPACDLAPHAAAATAGTEPFVLTRGRRQGGAQRPPTKVLSHAAVVRTAPPPPPPTFQQKLPEIRKQQGKPVTQVAALEMGLKDSTAPGHRISIRPAAVEPRRAGTPETTRAPPQQTAPKRRTRAIAQRPTAW